MTKRIIEAIPIRQIKRSSGHEPVRGRGFFLLPKARNGERKAHDTTGPRTLPENGTVPNAGSVPCNIGTASHRWPVLAAVYFLHRYRRQRDGSVPGTEFLRASLPAQNSGHCIPWRYWRNSRENGTRWGGDLDDHPFFSAKD